MPYLMAAMAGINAIGSIEQGQATSQALQAQSQLAEENAQEAETEGQFDATRSQMISGQKIGTQVADMGASNVDIMHGSAAGVLAMSHASAEMDRLNILHQADVKSIMYQNQAALDQYGAQSAVKGSYWSALGSLGAGLIKSQAQGTAATPQVQPAQGEQG